MMMIIIIITTTTTTIMTVTHHTMHISNPNIKKQMSENIYEMVCESKIMYRIEVRGLSEAWKELYKVHRDFARN
jgi:hypothetical protein